MKETQSFTVGNVFGQTGAVEIGVDAPDLFNNDMPVDRNTSVGSPYFLAGTDSFGRPSAVEKPRPFRFGARFSFSMATPKVKR